MTRARRPVFCAAMMVVPEPAERDQDDVLSPRRLQSFLQGVSHKRHWLRCGVHTEVF